MSTLHVLFASDFYARLEPDPKLYPPKKNGDSSDFIAQ